MFKFALLTLLVINLQSVHAAHIPNLFKQCYPCTAYGFYYCADDANLVNLNGDKCYSSVDDKSTYCNDFNFFSNPLLCSEVSLGESDQCDAIFGHGNMQYYTHLQRTITLPPRSACGFILYEYSAYLDIYHQYPMTLYHRDYKTVKYSDTNYIIKQSDDTGTLPGNSCYNQQCNNYFYVTYGQQYFHLVNWDNSQSQSVSFTAYDLGSTYLSIKTLSMLTIGALAMLSM